MQGHKRTRVPSLVGEDNLEKRMATYSEVFFPGKSSEGGAWRAAVCGFAKSETELKLGTQALEFNTIKNVQ